MTDNVHEMLAGYVDGELTEEQRQYVESELARSPELRAELEEFRKLKEVTGMAHYADLPEEVWDNYWESIYKRTERGIGWILLSLGAIALLCFGLYEVLHALYVDPEAPLWLKIGLTTLGTGAIFLLVSYARERLFAYKRDRYKEVTR